MPPLYKTSYNLTPSPMKRIELQIRCGCVWITIRQWENPHADQYHIFNEVSDKWFPGTTSLVAWRITVNNKFYAGSLYPDSRSDQQ